MANRTTLLLPVGTAVYPNLNEPRAFKDPKTGVEGPPKYSVSVRFDPETKKKVEEMLDAAYTKMGVPKKAAANGPWKERTDKESDETEELLKAACSEKFRPALFDAKNQTMPVTAVVGGGSKVRLEVTVNHYTGFGGGVNLYLNSVQVLEFVEGRGGKSPFEEADGFAYEGSDEEAVDHNEGDGDGALDL